MEFYPAFDVNENGIIDGAKERNVWRSVWTWTPPPIAEPGDRYQLFVDVTDAEGTIVAELKKEEPILIETPGEVVFESNRTGTWHLYTMWATGVENRVVPLTSGPVDHRCASVTADGRILAFQRGPETGTREVWIMNVDGTGKARVDANGYLPTISPTGTTIAYMQDRAGGTVVVVKRLDKGTAAEVSFPSVRTHVEGAPNPSNRIAYSALGDWVYFTGPGGDRVMGARLIFPGGDLAADPVSDPGAGVPNVKNSSQVGGLFSGRHGQVYYHADSGDPYIGRYNTGGAAPSAVALEFRKSVSQSEAFPAISPNEDLLLFCEKVGGSYQIFAVGMGQWTQANSGTQLSTKGENLRPAWIRQDKAF